MAATENETKIPAQYSDLLESTALAHIATTGPAGEPQVTPVWFGWDGQYVLFSNTKGRQKYKNVVREPRIALSIVDPQNPYRYLEIRGRVAEIREDEGNAFINSMAKKYMDQDVYPWSNPNDQRVIIVIEPEHTTSMG